MSVGYQDGWVDRGAPLGEPLPDGSCGHHTLQSPVGKTVTVVQCTCSVDCQCGLSV